MKFGRSATRKTRTSPAMEAGIAGHVWLIEELVQLLDKNANIAA
jgi:hypothetical protein